MTERRRRSPAYRPHLVVMARAPVVGAVKKRLAADIGAVAATAFYRAELGRMQRELAHDRRWRTVVAIAPDRSVGDRFWTAPALRMGQGPGDLGRRMARIMAILPPGPVVIVGSDIPGLGRTQVAAAFRALGNADAVFGPAADGGYYLVGFRRLAPIPDAFAAVRWSGPHALADTTANLRGRKIALIETLADIDSGADWSRWRAGLRAGPPVIDQRSS